MSVLPFYCRNKTDESMHSKASGLGAQGFERYYSVLFCLSDISAKELITELKLGNGKMCSRLVFIVILDTMCFS